MPRPPRLEFADAVYHVMSRGNARKRIFYGNDDRGRFLSQLQDNLVTHDVVLYAYVLMPNHYHLLVQTRRANLGRFMQRLSTSYSSWCGLCQGLEKRAVRWPSGAVARFDGLGGPSYKPQKSSGLPPS